MTHSDLASDYSEFQSHYEGESDRSVVILASSYIDSYLENFLAKRLVSHKRTKALFTGYAPLATFSAKIDISYAVGIIPEHLLKDLHQIRKIRNLFAHKADKLDFSSDEITHLCDQISYSKGMPRTDGTTGPKPEGARSVFLSTVYFLFF